MFRLLNLGLRPRVRTLPAARADVSVFDLYGRHVAFDANSLCAVEVDGTLARSLRAAADAARADPEAVPFRGLLFSRDRPQFPLVRPGRVRRVVLNVTHDCNLACAYCFARKKSEMSDRSDLSDMPFSVASEPLLGWELIRRVMAEAQALGRKRGVPVKFHVTTNGLLLDEEKIAFLSRRRCSVLVSLDGPEDLHNAARPARARGVNSFRRTMDALHRARRSPLARRVMARATFTADRPALRRRLEFFGNLLDDGLIRGFSVEPAVLAEGCAARAAKSDGSDASDLSDEYHAAAEWFVGRVKSGLRPGFFHFVKLLGRLAYARHAGAECGAGFGYVTVGPDGTLYACHREGGTRIGHVATGFDEEARAPWCDNRVYLRTGCSACWARYLCGGGCRQAALELAGNLNAAPRERCVITRTMLRECLWIMTQLTREELGRVVPR